MKTRSPILYVDDEPMNLELFERYFEDEYTIYTASSGRAALDVLNRETVHLLITDQRMPGMNGTELIETAQREHPNIASMIVTGYGDVRVILDAIQQGRLDHYVTKPWAPDELRIAMDRVLHSYGLRKTHRELQDELEVKTGHIPVPGSLGMQTVLRPTILYYGDVETNLEYFKNSFKHLYMIYTTADRSEAENILRTREIHLILAVQRPGVDGLDMLDQARQESPETLRILVTAYLEIGKVIAAIDQGLVYSYAINPWEPEELGITLASAVEVHSLRDENAKLEQELGRSGSFSF